MDPATDEVPPVRGRLTVYLGMAPGVGKTYAMLDEAHRRLGRGTDVVVGYVETHGRDLTAARVDGLEVVPRRDVEHRGVRFEEMDVDAVLARHPAVALVDELAHTNVPGSERAKRHEDVEVLLAAGIDVVTTLNVQHVESLNAAVEEITGVRQRETVPDAVVRAADQVQLVDMSPEALRRRLAHGNVYRPEQIDASLAAFFRPGNLIALRELALLWLADRVDTALDDYRRRQGIEATWPTRERVVVALTGGPESETLLRRAGRIAQRGAGGELLAVHVVRGDGLVDPGAADLPRLRRLVEDLGGAFHTVVGEDVAASLIEFARGVNASLVVVGESSHRRWGHVLRGTTASDVARLSGAIDVHLVTHEQAGGGGGWRVPRSTLGATRVRLGWLVAVLAPALLTLAFHGRHSEGTFPLEVLAFLAATVLVALVGGLWPALASAVAGFGLLNWFFTAPVGRFTIAEPVNVIALATFLAVAAAVASVVDVAARRAAEAGRARAEATTLSGLAQSVLTGSDTAQAVVDRLREAFGLTAVELMRRTPSGWAQVAASGNGKPGDDTTVTVDADHVLRLRGRTLLSSDVRVVEAFALQAGLVLEYRRLRDREAQATVLERAEATSTALLRAVSHDLRTPLATMTTSVDGLLGPGPLADDDRESLLAAIRGSSDQLTHLIDNLLDLSRISSGLVEPRLGEHSLEEVLPIAVAAHGPDRVDLDLDESTPLVRTDPGLLERVVANLVDNAVRHSPPGQPVRIGVHVHADTIAVRVVDRGPGVPAATRERMFEPFQRLGDASLGGLGLGLAVARGLAESMGAAIDAEDTPGGGLTFVVDVPRAGSGEGGT